MRKILFSLFLLARALALTAQGSVQEYVESVAREEPLRSAVVGVLAVSARGDTLAKYNWRSKLVPASNMKLITTGVALQRLGAGYRFETALGYDGEILDGCLHGNLYIIGGGDPTLGAEDTIAIPTDTLFSRWKGLLDAAGICSIDGFVVGDGRRFAGHLENTDWNIDDAGTFFGTGGDGLCFHENNLDFSIEPGDSIGAQPRIISLSRYGTPWLHIRNHTTTGAKDSGNSVLFFTSDLAPFAEWRGSFPLGRKRYLTSVSNKYGALTAAHAFCCWLDEAGVPVIDGPADIDRDGQIRSLEDLAAGAVIPSGAKESFLCRKAVPQDSLVRIGATLSPTLSEIARETNLRSDNFYAEMILRGLGLEVKGAADYDSAIAAEKAVLSKMGLTLGNSVRLSDGSGLARNNYASPDFLVRYLRAVWKSGTRGSFLGTLPRPGGRGTLENMMKKADSAVKKRIRLKSGSMNGVLCYSGYILPSDGTADGNSNVIFVSIMTNNASVGAAKVRPLLEGILVRLAAEN